MPSIQAQYNEEVVQAHREALKALRELLVYEHDPAERRRLAVAMLKARPVKDPDAEAASAQRPTLSEPSKPSEVSKRTIAPGNAAGSFTDVGADNDKAETPTTSAHALQAQIEQPRTDAHERSTAAA